MSYVSEVMADSPAAYYRMNEGSGQPQDSSGNANHTTGTTTGTIVYSETGAIITDPSSTAVYVDASRFTAPDHATLDLGDVFTLETWAKRDTMSGVQSLFDKGVGAYQFVFNTDNTLLLARSDTAVILSSTITITDTNWHHAVATKNGATAKIYCDGVDVSGTVTNSTMVNNTTVLNLSAGYAGTQLFSGTLDEMAVYPTALSQARIQAHYDAAFAAAAEKQTYYAYRRRSYR